MPYYGPKRKVFISFHQSDRTEVEDFLHYWTEREGVFIPKALGVSNIDDFIDSANPEYVMTQIRTKYLGDSTITMALLGSCTHSRRYVDWELKSSLRRGSYTPNGLLGIILPSCGKTAHLPPRFQDNWTSGHMDCYARLWVAPRSAEELGNGIEGAFSARTNRTHLIQNAATMMKNNRKCLACGVTH